MAWYLAPSLNKLRSEVNSRWPNRDKTNDGAIGDAAHAATRSDHNPNSRESVDAWDMDKDGVSVSEVIARFQEHPSAHYWIYQRQIADKDDGWTRRPYNGSNPHDKHVHFSIRQTTAAEQDLRSWGLEYEMTEEELIGATVKAIHSALDQSANRTTPTGRQMGDDIASLIARHTAPLATELSALRAQVTELATVTATRDAELRSLVQSHADGTVSAEAIVNRMGELLSVPE